MSATRMMILGLVGWMQPVHGYDVRRELLSLNADKWANVHPGSIYHALRKLTDEELLREVATEQQGGRPAKTSYEITEKGSAEFETLLHNYWWQLMPAVDPFMAAFAFLPAMKPEEASAALRNRAEQLRTVIRQNEAAMAAHWTDRKPLHATWMWELIIARAEAEIAWCERIAGRVESERTFWPPA